MHTNHVRIAIGVVALLAAGLWAQQQSGNSASRYMIPHTRGPINATIGSGNALDANMMRGSYGQNSTMTNPYAAGNTHISGLRDSRGLSGFHGSLSGLNGNLSTSYGGNTASVSSFRQQSVSLQDVLEGNVYNPNNQIYDDPLRRTVNANTVSNAQMTGQMPLPKNVTRVDQLANKLYIDALHDSQLFTPGDKRLHQNLSGRPHMAENMGLRFDSDTKKWDRTIRRVDTLDRVRRGGEELFGLMRGDDREQLAEELQQLEESTPEYRRAINSAVEHAVDAGVTATPGTSTDPAASGAALANVLAGPDSTAKPGTPASFGSKGILPDEDQDVFVDLLLNLRKKNKANIENPADPATTMKPDELLQKEMRLRKQRIERLQKLNAAKKLRGDLPSVEYDSTTREVVIHNLAGKGKDLFNQYMQRGEHYLGLKRPQFYDAARQYDLAGMVRPQNPLAAIGRAISSFGAGEWMTSAQHLERAMVLFPPIMESKFDLASMMNFDLDGMMNKETFSRRMVALDRWSKALNESPKLMLLQMFFYANRGDQENAWRVADAVLALEKSRREDLKKLQDLPGYTKKVANHDAAFSQAKTYAEYLLTKKTKPASPAKSN